MPEYGHYTPQALEPHFSKHVQAMTVEGLHAKGEIACELAWRDKEIAELRRWLGAAAERIDDWGRYASGYFKTKHHLQGDVELFDSLSRGEPVSEDVRRLYLGDEK